MNLVEAGVFDIFNLYKGEATAAHMTNQSGGHIITGQPRRLNIPAYQRPYRWEKERIDKLFKDYDEENAEYFIGSAVAVEQRNTGNSVFDLIDGQQRMTTLYLLNYVRFLLKREIVLHKFDNIAALTSIQSEFSALESYYSNLIGTNTNRFDIVRRAIEQISHVNAAGIDQAEQIRIMGQNMQEAKSQYIDQMCITLPEQNEDETIAANRANMDRFFADEQLCLSYTRTHYTNLLLDSMKSVFIVYGGNDTNRVEMKIASDVSEFAEAYTSALTAIFDNIMNRVNGALTYLEKMEQAVLYATSMLERLSFCLVLADNPDDAFKLFEVLNDRSLGVDDLELIKNHFYKEYVTKSGETNDVLIDQRINELDGIWVERIFPESRGTTVTRYISYFTAVYLTRDANLDDKNGAKFKDKIAENYSSQYSESANRYTYERIRNDFNIYQAVKIILQKYDIRYRDQNKAALLALAKPDRSISYRAMNLLFARDMVGVVSALINVIISNFLNYNNGNMDIDVFIQYLDDMLADYNHIDQRFNRIHECGHMLWIIAFKADDATTAREISRRIIQTYGAGAYLDAEISLTQEECQKLKEEFDIKQNADGSVTDGWLRSWNYNNAKKTFLVKALLLELLVRNRVQQNGTEYNSFPITLYARTGHLQYCLDAGKIQLDHLEPHSMSGNYTNYYMAYDGETRGTLLDSYLGNFMILDAEDNNERNNVPLEHALAYYANIQQSWLLEDIRSLMRDPDCFDQVENIPTDQFFKRRSILLRTLFGAMLDMPLSQTQTQINFIDFTTS